MLNWAISDFSPAAVRIARTPGYPRHTHTVIYQGDGNAYIDQKVRNGRTYRYTLVVTDQAGKTITRTVVATAGPHLLPLGPVTTKAPPFLQWTRVRKATYYNVQLFRGGKEILSAWPTTPGLQLRREWRFEGHQYRLKPGRYTWYVWPGFGRRSASNYGQQIGSLMFVVSRG
jgi:hypothetical protein